MQIFMRRFLPQSENCDLAHCTERDAVHILAAVGAGKRPPQTRCLFLCQRLRALLSRMMSSDPLMRILPCEEPARVFARRRSDHTLQNESKRDAMD